MGLSPTAQARLTVLGLTIGFHPTRRKWMLQRCHGEHRRSVVRFYATRTALEIDVLRIIQP